MPMVGHFSTFFIYPIVGDYLKAAAISLALVMGLVLSLLYFSYYYLFISLCKNKYNCALISVVALVLNLIIFKSHSVPAGNVHMFYTNSYNLYFFYVFPNILNSIIVLFLMRQLVLFNNLSIYNVASEQKNKVMGWLLVGVYFCIFSMLFSAMILLAFALVIILYKFIVFIISKVKILHRFKLFFKEIIINYNLVLLVIFGIIIAMLLEPTSVRSNDPGLCVFIYDTKHFCVMHSLFFHTQEKITTANKVVIAMWIYFFGLRVPLYNNFGQSRTTICVTY